MAVTMDLLPWDGQISQKTVNLMNYLLLHK
jgi:hypothetical protein